jgi:peroxisomal 2,4-dienoyl-CoA reductase
LKQSPTTIFRPDLLRGRVALVTGGGTGIGLGIAASLAAAGAEVAIASRKSEHLEPAAEQLRGSGGKVSTVEVNVREPESVRRMVDQVSQQHGRLDILVNNAAGNFYAPTATLSPNGWRAVVETDLYGTFYCCQAAHPVMKAQNGGRIISISMTLHYRGWPLMAHATAAKAGVDALTRTLALEWARDRITVNAVAPGPIPTEGVKQAFTPPGADAPDLFGMEQYGADSIPLGRWGKPEDIGQMVTYLASPAGDWITGAIMVVDGGAWLGSGAVPSGRVGSGPAGRPGDENL